MSQRSKIEPGRRVRPSSSKEPKAKDQYLDAISKDLSSQLVLKDKEVAGKTDVSGKHRHLSQRQPSSKSQKVIENRGEEAIQAKSKQTKEVARVDPVLLDAWSKVATIHRKFGRLKLDDRSSSTLARDSFVKNLECHFQSVNYVNSKSETDIELFVNLVCDGRYPEEEASKLFTQVKELRKYVSSIIEKTEHDHSKWGFWLRILCS